MNSIATTPYYYAWMYSTQERPEPQKLVQDALSPSRKKPISLSALQTRRH